MKLTTKKLSKRKLTALKKELAGNIGYIANECNCSASSVYSVLNGTFSNDKVISKCIEVRALLDIKLKEMEKSL